MASAAESDSRTEAGRQRSAVTPNHKLNTITRYAFAFSLVGLALAARLALTSHFQYQVPYGTFFLAVVLAAFTVGSGPTAVAIVLGYLCANWFFVEPVHTLVPHTSTDVAR